MILTPKSDDEFVSCLFWNTDLADLYESSKERGKERLLYGDICWYKVTHTVIKDFGNVAHR